MLQVVYDPNLKQMFLGSLVIHKKTFIELIRSSFEKICQVFLTNHNVFTFVFINLTQSRPGKSFLEPIS